MENYGTSWDSKTRAYFDSLPKLLQESIMQSGVRIQSEADLRSLSEQLSKTAKQAEK